MASINDLPAFPPKWFAKEKAQELLEVIKKTKEKK